MVLLPSWLRDEEDYLVDDAAVVQLACWATGAVDKEQWYSGEVPDEVWDIEQAGLVERVTDLIEKGTSWKTALALVQDQL
jgi:hypothetical protein